MSFADRLTAAVRRCGNPVLVGIDPRVENLPEGLLDTAVGDAAAVARAFEAFGRSLVDVVAPQVPAVKFQAAFYEALGPAGVAALHSSMRYARQQGLIVLFDGKRNDIGSTAEAYAEGYLGRTFVGGRELRSWDADAVTVNPYLGTDGIAPFVDAAAREDKGLFVLVRTSNPSAGEFQDLDCGGRPLYRRVAEATARWAEGHRGASGYSLVGAVVGATGPVQLAELRAALPGILLLVPGYGSQGGTAKDVAAAFDANGLGALINNSRGIIFAHERPAYRDRFGGDWQRAVEAAVRDMIDELAAETTTCRLR
jgi:orotidine-5'-phosphate decarboxylase